MRLKFAISFSIYLCLLATVEVKADVYSDLIESQNPLLYWRLGDASGPTATNLGSLGASGNGTYGSAVNYNQSSLVSSSSDSSLGFSKSVDSNVVLDGLDLPSSEVSISFWVNGQDNGLSHFFGYGVGSNSNEFTFGSADGIFRTIVQGSGQDYALDVLDGTSHHIGISWAQSSGNLLVYVDGSLAINRTVAAGSPIESNGVLALGQDLDSTTGPGYGFDANQAFDGDLDEFVVFNRVLSQSEFNSQFMSVPEPASTIILSLIGIHFFTKRRR